jgi:hypothetical protein
MKELIETGNRCLGTDEPSVGHKLLRLWASCRLIMVTAWPSTPSNDLDAMEAVLHQLHGVDPGGTAFRYPESLAGERSLPTSLRGFNLRAFVEGIKECTSTLDGTTVGSDAENEQRMEMRREMADLYEP